MESHLPLRVTRYELRADALAAGRWRGGMGSVREFVYLSDGGASVEGEGHKYRPWGFAGGQDGFPAEIILERHGGEPRHLPSKVPYMKIMAGDRIVAIGPAGGGYGDPLEREPEQVLSDLLDEYITAEMAERDYGVVIADGVVDQVATSRCRTRARTSGERVRSTLGTACPTSS